MSTRINYNGPKTPAALDKFCKEQSQGCFITCTTVYHKEIITKYDKLPTSSYAPSDYPDGYYKNGKLVQWSAARKIKAQNTGNGH